MVVDNKRKLAVCIMGQDCEKFISMCYESVKNADAIVFCDGGSKDGTIDYLKSKGFVWEPCYKDDNPKTMIFQRFDKIDPEMNGKQRNFYLNYLKKSYPDHWALCIDADEVVDELQKIKEFIQEAKEGVYSPRMRHFIGDLGHEDAVQPIHPVINRLFTISHAIKYPLVEHPVLEGINVSEEIVMDTTVWHLAYIPNLWSIKKRYEEHLLKSNMHTPDFLRQWYAAHLFGTYPRSDIDPLDIPRIILENFGIEKDAIYFANRVLENKHWVDVCHWKDFFDLGHRDPKKKPWIAERDLDMIIFGDGVGVRTLPAKTVGLRVWGSDSSDYAVNNCYPEIKDCYSKVDITEEFRLKKADLVVAYDVLEHIPYGKLDKAIIDIIESSKKHILISVPVIGDPNLEADKTHLIKETKDWWIKKFTNKGLGLIKTPEHFLFRDQIMIFKK